MKLSRRRSVGLVVRKRAYWEQLKTILGTTLIGYWPLWDKASPALDLSGNNLSGTCANVTFSQSGFGDSRTSASFNGTSSVMNIYSATLNTLLNKHEGTFAAWVKVTNADVWSDGGYRYLFALQADASNSIYVYKDGGASNQLRFVYAAGGVTGSLTIPGLAYTDFFHLAVTWSKSLNIMRVYINGEPDMRETFGLTGTWVGDLATTTSCVGAGNMTPAGLWKGNIQHAVLCNRSLPPDKISDLASLTRMPSFPYAYKAPAALVTPTYDGSNEAVHPDVYDAGEGNTWNGHRYWMAMTPYPAADATKENPSILVSEDGGTWTVPDGLTNPVEAYPGSSLFNADTDLIIGVDTMAYLFFTQNSKIWRKSSSDGITWTAKADITVDGRVSPAIAYDGSIYHLWSMDVSASPYKMYHRTAATPNGAWSAEELCTLSNLPAGMDLWHINVNYNNGTWDALFTTATAGTSGAGGKLYFATSSDGLAWLCDNLPLLNTGFGWDLNLYRACMVSNANGYDMWYSAQGAPNVWKIGRTQIYTA